MKVTEYSFIDENNEIFLNLPLLQRSIGKKRSSEMFAFALSCRYKNRPRLLQKV